MKARKIQITEYCNYYLKVCLNLVIIIIILPYIIISSLSIEILNFSLVQSCNLKNITSQNRIETLSDLNLASLNMLPGFNLFNYLASLNMQPGSLFNSGDWYDEFAEVSCGSLFSSPSDYCKISQSELKEQANFSLCSSWIGI